MYDWIQIISNQWYRTLSTHEITWVCCELNGSSREYITRSHIKLNKFGLRGKMSPMQQKCHWGYYVNLLISEYLSYSQQVKLATDGKKCHRGVLLIFLNQFISNISNLYNLEENLRLSYQTKRDIIFSDPESDYIFPFFFFQFRTWFIYFFFLYARMIHLLRRGECVGIYCKLITNWIESTQARIFFLAQYKAGIQNQNSNNNWRSVSI